MFRVDIEDFPIFFFVSEATFTRVYLHLNGSEEKVLGLRESDCSDEGVQRLFSVSWQNVPPLSKERVPRAMTSAKSSFNMSSKPDLNINMNSKNYHLVLFHCS